MASTKRRPSGAPKSAAGSAPVREDRIVPFLQKYSTAIAACLILLAAVRIVSTYNELSITSDEPSHLACGMEYLSRHTYRYETQHPPLTRVMAALGPYLAGSRTIGLRLFAEEGIADIRQSGQPIRTTFLMRLGILPFFVLACVVVFVWARRYYGKATAVLATALFTLLPTVLADGGLATTDMGLAACLGLAFFSMLLWAETPTWQHGLFFGFSTALAVLAKFSSLVFFPCAAVLALAAWWASARPTGEALVGLIRERWATLGVAVAVGALTIWGVYGFTLDPFFDGIRSVQEHNLKGHTSYLLGWMSQTGFWYYFPVALAVKTPIPFLVLLSAGLMVVIRRWTNAAYLMPLAFSLGVLLPSMAANIDIGIRHVLPIYIGLSLMAAMALLRLPQWMGRKAGTIVGGALIALMLLSGAMQHPNYLSYFNLFAGDSPEKVLGDSNYDWGQSSKIVGKYLRARGIHEVSFFGLNGSVPAEELESWYGMPHIGKLDLTLAAGGWYVVSPALLVATANRFTQLTPSARVGSVLLYYVPPALVKFAP